MNPMLSRTTVSTFTSSALAGVSSSVWTLMTFSAGVKTSWLKILLSYKIKLQHGGWLLLL